MYFRFHNNQKWNKTLAIKLNINDIIVSNNKFKNEILYFINLLKKDKKYNFIYPNLNILFRNVYIQDTQSFYCINCLAKTINWSNNKNNNICKNCKTPKAKHCDIPNPITLNDSINLNQIIKFRMLYRQIYIYIYYVFFE